VINGKEQQAAWLWRGEAPQPEELWLPLEVLQGQLGVQQLVDECAKLPPLESSGSYLSVQ
jgi:hypothetical protein